ncbi:hypothetical protein P3T76_002340 [Phytophthora citrophthora]|uniref:Uncharacterized protein n=1 Tax=Phytophthora citrophthora TaxID=4793 RepID=A0AAD9GZ80_9STRA|nr:hypothetical protein P3T76_002340 [Phytophthora citrophthora]
MDVKIPCVSIERPARAFSRNQGGKGVFVDLEVSIGGTGVKHMVSVLHASILAMTSSAGIK